MLANYKTVLCLMIIVGLSACGGGSGGNLGNSSSVSTNNPQPSSNLVGITPTNNSGLVGIGSAGNSLSTITAEGIWQGTSSTSRTLTGLITDNGDYWLLYSAAGNPNILAGVVIGNSFSANNSLATNTGRDFNFETGSALRVSWRGSYVPLNRLQGTLSYLDAPSSGVTFNATYNPTYSLAPNLSAIAGTYSGTATNLERGSQSSSLTIQSNGQVSGRRADGCTFVGTLTPRPRGNAYSIHLNYSGSSCPDRNAYSRGAAFFSQDNRQLYSAALMNSATLTNSLRDGEDTFVFIGRR